MMLIPEVVVLNVRPPDGDGMSAAQSVSSEMSAETLWIHEALSKKGLEAFCLNSRRPPILSNAELFLFSPETLSALPNWVTEPWIIFYFVFPHPRTAENCCLFNPGNPLYLAGLGCRARIIFISCPDTFGYESGPSEYFISWSR